MHSYDNPMVKTKLKDPLDSAAAPAGLRPWEDRALSAEARLAAYKEFVGTKIHEMVQTMSLSDKGTAHAMEQTPSYQRLLKLGESLIDMTPEAFLDLLKYRPAQAAHHSGGVDKVKLTSAGEIVSLGAEGAYRWSRTVNGTMTGRPIAHWSRGDQAAFVGEDSIVCLNKNHELHTWMVDNRGDWQWKGFERTAAKPDSHNERIYPVAEDMLVHCTNGGHILYWKKEPGASHFTEIGAFMWDSLDRARVLAGLPDGRIVATNAADDVLVFGRMGDDVEDEKIGRHRDLVIAAGVTQEGQAFSVDQSHHIKIYKPGVLWGWRSTELSGEGQVSCASVLPDGRIVIGRTDGRVSVWSKEAGGWRCSTPDVWHHDLGVREIKPLPGGDFVTGSMDCRLRVWRETTPGVWAAERLDEHTADITSIDVGADGRIVSAGSDGKICVWQRGVLPHEDLC